MPPKSKKTAVSKRAAPETPNRQSKRAKAATTKSYAEPETDDDVEGTNARSSEDDATLQSDYEVESHVDQSSESDRDDAISDEDNKANKVVPKGRSAKRSTLPKNQGNNDLWKSGAKLELGTQVIIKKPKAREAGDTPYTDDSIHPNTMLFLGDLAANNDRQWLKGEFATCTTHIYLTHIGIATMNAAELDVAHDADYRTSLQDFNTFVECLSEKVSTLR